MIRAGTLLIVLCLAGCSSGPGEDTPEGQCRKQAYQDPDVKDAIERANTNLQQVRAPALMQEADLVRRATQRCLAAQGLAPRGGVEPVKPY